MKMKSIFIYFFGVMVFLFGFIVINVLVKGDIKDFNYYFEMLKGYYVNVYMLVRIKYNDFFVY